MKLKTLPLPPPPGIRPEIQKTHFEEMHLSEPVYVIDLTNGEELRFDLATARFK